MHHLHELPLFQSCAPHPPCCPDNRTPSSYPASSLPVQVKEKKPHIKKPLNAFMLFMKSKRAEVIKECTLKESAAINQILGKMVSSTLHTVYSMVQTTNQSMLIFIQKVLCRSLCMTHACYTHWVYMSNCMNCTLTTLAGSQLKPSLVPSQCERESASAESRTLFLVL